MISQHNRLHRVWQTSLSLIAHAGLLAITSIVPYLLGHQFAFSHDVSGVAAALAAWAILAVTEEHIQPAPPATTVADDTRWRRVAQHALWLTLPLSAWDASFQPLLFLAGGLLLLLGMTLRIWSLRTLGPLFTATAGVIEGHRVILSGPYRFLKHPNYAGSVLLAAGTALSAGSRSGWLCVGILALSVVLASRHESAFLQRNLPDY